MANSLKVTKSHNNCCVPQCNSTYKDNVSLHKFPKCPKLSLKWKITLQIGKNVTENMKVCSKHFKDEDFILKDYINKSARLKKNILPSLKLPRRLHDRKCNVKLIQERCKRMERRLKRFYNEQGPEISKELNVTTFSNNIDARAELAAHTLLSFSKKPVEFSVQKFEEKGVQVDTSEDLKMYNIDKLVCNDHSCKVLTGVQNLNLLLTLVNGVSKLQTTKTNLSPKNLVLLTLMKLKLDLSFSSLAILFQISSSSAQLYFHTTIVQLSTLLKQLIRFPSKEEILSNVPVCFTKYKSTRVVLDCTEIPIEKSKCLKCRIKSYSVYKKRHTIKYLVGVAPSGLITYISKGYGGRASDKAIFNAEDVINQVDPGDAIMVDKGILINKECNSKLVKLIHPPFLQKNTKQFSKNDVETTADVARARVHVERAIQRIKIFKIFKGTLSWSILPYIDDIMIVVVALTNLGPPLLSNDKFQQ